MKTNKKLSNRISAYGLMSSAFVAAGVHQAEGQIVYVDPVDMPIEVLANFSSGTNQTAVSSFKLVNLDVQNAINPIAVFDDLTSLNDDSAYRFGLWAGGSRITDLSSVMELDFLAASAGVNNSDFLGDISSIVDVESLPLDAVVNNSPPGTNLRLGAGGVKNLAASGGTFMKNMATGGGTYWSGGNFANNLGQNSSQTGYIGVTFDINGDMHNGWIQLTLELNTQVTGPNSGNSSTKLTIHDFAYNSIPNASIKVGQIAILPVELINFESQQSNSNIELNWSTATETNHDYFQVEKSANGTDFESLHRIQGDGDSNEHKDYNYIDTEPLNGDNYYRLKQVDLDGSFSYSDILYEKLVIDSKYSISPNPFTDKIKIEFPNQDHNGLFISLIDMSGKSVFNHFETDASVRFYDININDLPNGVYFLQIIDNNKIIREKLMKH